MSREKEILRKNEKEILEKQNIATEMKNEFDGLIHRLGTSEERVNDLRKCQQKFPVLKFKMKKESKRWDGISQNCRETVVDAIYA